MEVHGMRARLIQIGTYFSDNYLPRSTLLIAALIPLKLSLTYLVLIPSVILWLFTPGSVDRIATVYRRPYIWPLLLFLLFACFSALFGLQPIVSLQQLGGLLFFLLIVPFFSTALSRVEPTYLLLALLLGQTVSSFHSVLQAAFPASIERLFIGTVSESGQLAIAIPLALGLSFAARHTHKQGHSGTHGLSLDDGVPFLACISCVGVLGFSSSIGVPLQVTAGIAFGLAAFLAYVVFSAGRELVRGSISRATIARVTLRYCIPVLLIALLVNLKRGPWLGVTIGVSLFLFLYYRKVLVPLVVALILIASSITPVRDRLAQSSQHFFISGGRSTIWAVGTELAVQYPLGIGFENSSFLRKFAPEIPPELVHFHNNMLNIVVETGWLGLFIFLWWLIAILRRCFSDDVTDACRPLARSIGCSIIAWQAAGLVEYNFGDSEVLLVVLVAMAVLVAVSEHPDRPRP